MHEVVKNMRIVIKLTIISDHVAMEDAQRNPAVARSYRLLPRIGVSSYVVNHDLTDAL